MTIKEFESKFGKFNKDDLVRIYYRFKPGEPINFVSRFLTTHFHRDAYTGMIRVSVIEDKIFKRGGYFSNYGLY